MNKRVLLADMEDECINEMSENNRLILLRAVLR
jgi:hypothetical protein